MRTNWHLAFGLSDCWPAGCWLVIYTRLLKHPVFHSISFIHSGGWLYPCTRHRLTDARGGLLPAYASPISNICLVIVQQKRKYVKRLSVFGVQIFSFSLHLSCRVLMSDNGCQILIPAQGLCCCKSVICFFLFLTPLDMEPASLLSFTAWAGKLFQAHHDSKDRKAGRMSP